MRIDALQNRKIDDRVKDFSSLKVENNKQSKRPNPYSSIVLSIADQWKVLRVEIELETSFTILVCDGRWSRLTQDDFVRACRLFPPKLRFPVSARPC